MGVPAFFQWIVRKYPSIVEPCIKQNSHWNFSNSCSSKITTDFSRVNDTESEFENLFLDLEMIIQGCCRPGIKPAPQNVDELMAVVFEYIDALFDLVRPRRLLYLALDGVTARAKMDQQRARRFRDTKGQHEDVTLGAEFMHCLSHTLACYIQHRQNTDPGWAAITVIFSDANVPGEGEQKMVDYIRRQRDEADYLSGVKHCLYGSLNGDLVIPLLATHEVKVTVIQEKRINNNNKNLIFGHPADNKQEFEFLRLNLLRECLFNELDMPYLSFPHDPERSLDDWILMCCFVGNDFLPSLPSLEIGGSGMDTLITLYKQVVERTSGYLTDRGGIVDLSRVQVLLDYIAMMEDDIFKDRRRADLSVIQRDDHRNKRPKTMTTNLGPLRLLRAPYDQAPSAFTIPNSEGLLKPSRKRKASEDTVDNEPQDEVKLWEAGFKDRYYKAKFSIDSKNPAFSRIKRTISEEYMRDVCLLMKYFYRGCTAWTWCYPHSSAPFASDFVNLGNLVVENETISYEPFRSQEHLMTVFLTGNICQPYLRPQSSRKRRGHKSKSKRHLMDVCEMSDIYDNEMC